MDKLRQHWTEKSIDDFVYRISSDFVIQLEKRLKQAGIAHKKLAKMLDVSEGRVSQVFNNPGNLTLTSTVQYTRALDMKVALVAYDDGDPKNYTGPVSSEIFYVCWKRAGSPRNFFALGSDSANIHQLDPYPNTSENTQFHLLSQSFPKMTAGTYCTERLQ